MARNKKVAAYMTVEATFIFVTALSIIVFVVSIGLYQYERCVFELETYYELQKSIQEGECSRDYIELKDGKGEAEREKGSSLLTGIFGEQKTTIYVKADMKQLNPAHVLRWKQRLVRKRENGDRENQPTIPENGEQ